MTIDPRLLPVVSDTARRATTDQFWQGATFTADGSLVGDYDDRSYGNANGTGYTGIAVSASHDRVTFSHMWATSSWMPPPTQFNGQFTGDYVGVDATTAAAYPIWSDTRPVDEFLRPDTGTPAVPRRCVFSRHTTRRSPTIRTSRGKSIP